MKNKKYTFGGVTFEMDAPFPLIENESISLFRSQEETDYLIRVVVGKNGNIAKKKLDRNGTVITVYLPDGPADGISVQSLLSMTEVPFLFPEQDAFILHASYIIHEGYAILFTAPSGTGKSTQAEYWRERRGAEIINGDRVLITKRDGQYYANGIYACGTSGICRNVTAPIGAVVLLEQGEQNRQNRIPSRMLFLRILCQCSFNMNDTAQYEAVTALLSDMINRLPVICYSCRRSPDAVEALERILWKKE